MHPLLTRLRTRPSQGPTPIHPSHTTAAKRPPRLSARQPRATYYFDASQHTSMSLRLLLNQLQTPKTFAESRGTRDFLHLSVDNLLQSIRPGIDDDIQSRRYFFSLLRMHLSHLTADELHQLSEALKTSQFNCNVMETVIDDEVYRDHGFANGPPHAYRRTLMQTQDFFDVLDDLTSASREFKNRSLRSAMVSAARNALPVCINHWQQSEKTPEDLFHSVCLLGKALDLPTTMTTITTGMLETQASTVVFAGDVLTIDSAMADALAADEGEVLFADLLRDLLELLITHKLFGISAPPDRLTGRQRQDLSAVLEKIYTSPRPCSDPQLKAKARTVLDDAHNFGQIQIQPTTGVALGHAWIAPVLSMVPDKKKSSVDIGNRYMHSGFHLEAGNAAIREWPAHFMTARENDESYPTEHAWHVRVPVDSQRLQSAAQEVIREWQTRKLPYRFTGTTPGMSATGCRVTVWEAVRRGMRADARTLFDYYNCGLPDPQSPTELWQRLDGLLQWIESLAAE